MLPGAKSNLPEEHQLISDPYINRTACHSTHFIIELMKRTNLQRTDLLTLSVAAQMKQSTYIRKVAQGGLHIHTMIKTRNIWNDYCCISFLTLGEGGRGDLQKSHIPFTQPPIRSPLTKSVQSDCMMSCSHLISPQTPSPTSTPVFSCPRVTLVHIVCWLNKAQPCTNCHDCSSEQENKSVTL